MSKYLDFTSDVWKHIENEIERYLNLHEGPHYAAFDADGTLWDIDAGETFFKYQLDHSQLKGLPEDPWNHYHHWKELDPRSAYLWLAQISKDHSLAQVRHWGRACLKSNPNWPIYPSQKKLIQFLRSRGIRVYIVTASIKWAVEPFVELLGLHYDDVIGVETKIESGIVTDIINGRITWKEGKAETLLEKTQGVAPLFCSGNTMGDVELINCSQLLKMAVHCSSPGDELYETELSLQKIARENFWLTHSFK